MTKLVLVLFVFMVSLSSASHASNLYSNIESLKCYAHESESEPEMVYELIRKATSEGSQILSVGERYNGSKASDFERIFPVNDLYLAKNGEYVFLMSGIKGGSRFLAVTPQGLGRFVGIGKGKLPLVGCTMKWKAL